MRCCTIKLKRSWEYCPGCGEAIEWPPTKAEVIAQAEREAVHRLRMKTDPAYAKMHENSRLLYNWHMSELAKQYADQDDPFMGLAEAVPVLRGEDKDVAV